MTIKRYILLSSLIGIFLLSTHIGVSYAVESSGFGSRPAYPRADNPRTESIFVHTLSPGTVQDEGVRVINNSDGTRALRVYAADSIRSTDGGFACKQYSDANTDVGAWITLEQTEVTLPPHSNIIVPFTITIPEKASVGEHNGCVLIEDNTSPNTATRGAVISTRSGLRVAITVPGDIIRKLESAEATLNIREDNSLLLSAAAINQGNVSIDTDVVVFLRTFFGKIIAEDGGRFPVLRGEKSIWNFAFERPFWGGWYNARVMVAYDADPDATTGVDTNGDRTVFNNTASVIFVTPHWIAIVIYSIALAGVLIGTKIVYVRRRMKRWITKKWINYSIKEGDTIDSLAREKHIPWKILVKVNKLNPPYILKPGEKIRLPQNKRKKKR